MGPRVYASPEASLKNWVLSPKEHRAFLKNVFKMFPSLFRSNVNISMSPYKPMAQDAAPYSFPVSGQDWTEVLSSPHLQVLRSSVGSGRSKGLGGRTPGRGAPCSLTATMTSKHWVTELLLLPALHKGSGRGAHTQLMQ